MRGGAVGFRSGMQKAVQLGIGLIFIANAVAILLALTPLQAKGEEVLSPAAQRGLVIVRTNCSRCHAIGKVGESPLPIAPPLRTLHERYPVEDLQEPLAEGIVTGHPTMPRISLRLRSGRRHYRVSEVARALTQSAQIKGFARLKLMCACIDLSQCVASRPLAERPAA